MFEVMGMLKQEKGDYHRSREYFEKALKATQKHLSIDNIRVQVLKKRIEILVKFTNDSKSRMPAITFKQARNDSESQ